MAVTVIERPYTYCFSKNEIKYVFNVDNLTRSGLKLQIKIMYKHINDNSFIAMPAFMLKPLSNGNVYLNIQQYIDSVLEYVLPNFNDTTTHAEKQYCMFYVEYREVTDESTPSYITDESNNIRYALKGGISKEKFSRNNFFINYFEPQKPFLTWQPQDKFIFLDQNMWLTFFVSGGLGNGSLAIAEITTFGDNAETFTEENLLPASNGWLWHIKINNLFSTTNSIYQIRIKIVDSSNNDITSWYSFKVDYRPVYNKFDLNFFNSVGGFDFSRVRGEIEYGIDKSSTEIEGGFDNNEAFNTTKSHELKHDAIIFSKTYKGDIGFLNRKIEQDAMIELIISKGVYLYSDERFIPVLNVQKTSLIRKQSDEVYGFPIEFTTSIKNTNYTPDYINLSLGNNN